MRVSAFSELQLLLPSSSAVLHLVPARCRYGHQRTPAQSGDARTRIPLRARTLLCQTEWQKGCKIECQIECQIQCQTECQIECQIECQNDSEYMSDRMLGRKPDEMSEYMSGRMSVGGDHSHRYVFLFIQKKLGLYDFCLHTCVHKNMLHTLPTGGFDGILSIGLALP